jgi:hypothetical protein
MTYDDYRQMRSMYADADDLCRGVEQAQGASSDERLRRLVGLLRDQQREPEQIRSFLRHLGMADEVIVRVLEEVTPGADPEDGTGSA